MINQSKYVVTNRFGLEYESCNRQCKHLFNSSLNWTIYKERISYLNELAKSNESYQYHRILISSQMIDQIRSIKYKQQNQVSDDTNNNQIDCLSKRDNLKT